MKTWKEAAVLGLLALVFCCGRLSSTSDHPLVKFKVLDYNPSTKLFELKPTKPVRYRVSYVRQEGGEEWPRLLLKVGKKVKCEVIEQSIGVLKREGISYLVHSWIFDCEGERFRSVHPVFTAE